MKNQIKSLLIHELGHLCVDIIIEDEFQDLYVEKLVIRNFECENLDWCGYVDMEPQELLGYENVIDNIKLFPYKLISLISGCAFQQIISENNIDISPCFEFSKKLIGSMDYRKYHHILFLLRKSNKNYQKNRDTFYGIVNDNLEISYLKSLKGLNKLNERIDELADEEVSNIIDNFNEKGKPKKFEYIYENDALGNLKDSLKVIIEEIGFKELITGLHENLVQEFKVLGEQS